MKRLLVFVFAVILLGSCVTKNALYKNLPKSICNFNNIINHNEKEGFKISTKNDFFALEQTQPKEKIIKVLEKPYFKLSENLEKEDEILFASKSKSTIKKKHDLKFISNIIKAPNFLEQKCADLKFRNGSELRVKIIEITPKVVKYKKCDKPDGPLYTINKYDLLFIRYNDGSKEIIKTEKENRLVEGYSITSLVLCILSLFFLNVVILFFSMMTLSLVFAIVGLTRFLKNPQKYKGKGFAIPGLIFGSLSLLLLFLLLGTV